METTTMSLEDRIDAFLLGRIDETTRIDKDNIGIIGFIGEFVAVPLGIPEQDFGIDQILGTAKADQADLTGFR
jgi:hypothetical protein